VTPHRALKLLVLILRLDGAVTVLAFGAMLLPVDWVADTHRWLGLGDFPNAPVTDYLVRSVCALYGSFGVLFLLVAGDPLRYQRIVRYIGVMHIIFGVLMIPIDLHAGMPAWWTMIEGPPLVGVGVLTLFLLNRAARA